MGFQLPATKSQTFKTVGISLIASLFIFMVAMRLTAQPPIQKMESRALPVRTVQVTVEPGHYAARSFTGRAVAGRTSRLAFELGGTIKSVYVDLGTKVSKGDTLALLDTSRLEANKNQILAEREEVAASLNLANRTLKRAQDTFSQGHASAQRLDEAEANAITFEARLKRLDASLASLAVDIEKSTLKSPFDGLITARNLDEGTVVGAGTALLEVTENSRMEAHIGMPPKYALAANNGTGIELRDGKRNLIEGVSARSVVPVIEGGTRTMMVTFDLPANSVTRGELITAVVKDWHEGAGVWLPLRALSSDVRGLWRVYKVVTGSDDLHVRFENVQILHSESNRAFVSGTLSEGDIIIADGLERLAPGQRVSLKKTPTNSRS